jgi:ketosteroid isomerase-like protein
MSMRRDGLAGTLMALPAGTRESRKKPADPALREATLGESRPKAESLPKEEVVARLFEAFSRRDLPSALALVHPEVVFQPMTAAVTQAGEPYRGHEGIRRYARDIESHWEELTVIPAQIRAAGRAVVALGLVSGRGAGGSFRDAPTTWVVKFRDGLVAHAQIFSDERHVVNALVRENS